MPSCITLHDQLTRIKIPCSLNFHRMEQPSDTAKMTTIHSLSGILAQQVQVCPGHWYHQQCSDPTASGLVSGYLVHSSTEVPTKNYG